MIKKILTIVAIIMFGMVSMASAIMTVSDVALTSNSLTFTIDGDMSGYSGYPNMSNVFSIEYLGDIYNSLGYTSNNWSSDVFDNKVINFDGNTGTWSNHNYTWSMYYSNLPNAVASNRIITLTTGNSYFNPTETGTINFIWGNPKDDNILLDSINYNGNSAPVPEPATILLLGVGLMGLGIVSHKKS